MMLESSSSHCQKRRCFLYFDHFRLRPVGLDDEALKMFRILYDEGMECNYVTFSSLLTAVAGLASLDYGKQVHGFIIRCQLPFYAATMNSMLYMYAKAAASSTRGEFRPHAREDRD
ncbi:Pentatricopeptide repeat-containing protein [Platanthera guangdongensis]|uniref:Pentatricopeptide repeat-containing protein n=1 Tax=Platanthera guangdongensis TaxID=2320717 RepID=A0ABR2MFV3_9ASPA